MPFFINSGEEVKSGGLTLNEPSSPDRIVQTDLISPQQPQTLKRLPLGGDYLTAANKTHNQSENRQFVQMENGQCSLHCYSSLGKNRERGTDTIFHFRMKWKIFSSLTASPLLETCPGFD